MDFVLFICGYVVVDAETEKDAIELTENMGIRWICRLECERKLEFG
jgi:hypothetical protein